MLLLFVLLAGLCEVTAALAALLLGLSFTSAQRSHHAFLGKVDRHRLVILVSAVISVILHPIFDDAAAEADRRKENRRWSDLRQMISELGPQGQLADQAEVDYVAVGMIVGTEHFKDGAYDTALDWFHAVDEVVDSATLTAKIADCYYNLKRYSDAIRFERRAARQAPGWSGPPYIEALSYYHLGRISEALAAADRSCALGFQGGCELADKIRSE